MFGMKHYETLLEDSPQAQGAVLFGGRIGADMYNLIDIVCIFSGGYLAYSAITMKSKGEIIANVVFNKAIDERALKDKEGFINYLSGKLLLIGIVIILAGAVDVANSYMGGSSIIGIAALLVFVAALVAYSLVTKAALEKFT